MSLVALCDSLMVAQIFCFDNPISPVGQCCLPLGVMTCCHTTVKISKSQPKLLVTSSLELTLILFYMLIASCCEITIFLYLFFSIGFKCNCTNGGMVIGFNWRYPFLALSVKDFIIVTSVCSTFFKAVVLIVGWLFTGIKLALLAKTSSIWKQH